MVDTQTRLNIAIVGAGLSGLFLAYRLRSHGHRVTIYEADARAGGRILTTTNAICPALHADAGAEGIADGDVALRELLKKLDVQLIRPHSLAFRPEQMWVQGDGDPVTLSEAQQDTSGLALQLRDEERAGFPHSLLAHAIRRRLSKVFDHEPAKRGDPRIPALENISLHDFVLKEAGGEQTLESLARFSPFAVYPAKSVSAYWALAQEYRAHSAGSISIVKGGTERIIEGLLQQDLGNLMLNCPVTHFDLMNDSVEVSTINGKWQHDVIVLTGAPGALSLLSSSLPTPVRRAVECFKPGALLKVHLLFRDRFWEMKNWSGLAWTDHRAGYVWNSTFAQDAKAGILTCFLPGPRALDALSSTEGPVRFCLKGIEQLCPGASDYFETGWYHDWGSSPYMGAAVYYLSPGKVQTTLRSLTHPYGRLLIAGDHTTTQSGYMVGALESARRVEEQIQKILQIPERGQELV
jgi:monoamine oxidase